MNKDLLIKISKVVILISFFIVGFIALLFKESKPLILGYIFGASISILTFRLMSDSINKSVEMKQPSRAQKHAYINYLMRFTIYAVVLVVSALADYLNVITALLGLTMVRNSILLLNVFDKNFYR